MRVPVAQVRCRNVLTRCCGGRTFWFSGEESAVDDSSRFQVRSRVAEDEADLVRVVPFDEGDPVGDVTIDEVASLGVPTKELFELIEGVSRVRGPHEVVRADSETGMPGPVAGTDEKKLKPHRRRQQNGVSFSDGDLPPHEIPVELRRPFYIPHEENTGGDFCARGHFWGWPICVRDAGSFFYRLLPGPAPGREEGGREGVQCW